MNPQDSPPRHRKDRLAMLYVVPRPAGCKSPLVAGRPSRFVELFYSRASTETSRLLTPATDIRRWQDQRPRPVALNPRLLSVPGPPSARFIRPVRRAWVPNLAVPYSA